MSAWERMTPLKDSSQRVKMQQTRGLKWTQQFRDVWPSPEHQLFVANDWRISINTRTLMEIGTASATCENSRRWTWCLQVSGIFAHVTSFHSLQCSDLRIRGRHQLRCDMSWFIGVGLFLLPDNLQHFYCFVAICGLCCSKPHVRFVVCTNFRLSISHGLFPIFTCRLLDSRSFPPTNFFSKSWQEGEKDKRITDDRSWNVMKYLSREPEFDWILTVWVHY